MAGKHGRTAGPKLKTAEMRRQCIALRRSGATYAAIGDQLGITRGGAFKNVQRYLTELQTSSAEDMDFVKALELERLDRMFMGLWRRAMDGDAAAVDKALKIMDRRAKYLGLDMPAKIAPTDPTGDTPYDPITDTERASRLEAILATARDRRDREASVSAEAGGADPA